jgi:hypothetical protein
MSSSPARPWVSRLIVTLVLVVPIVAFFVLQAVSVHTRSGSLEEVWRVQGPAGPLLLARDQIVVGTERAATLRNRLTLVDATTGKRLTRERIDEALTFLGQDEAGLWFGRRVDGGDVHARSVRTLKRLEAQGPPPSFPAPSGRPPPVTLPLADPGPFDRAEWVVDARGEPLRLADPPSVLIVHREGEGDHGQLALSRVSPGDEILWTAKLERQRGLRGLWRQDGALLLVTSGAARDFALLLDARTGATRWVHYF